MTANNTPDIGLLIAESINGYYAKLSAIDHKMIKLVESLSKDYAAYQKQLTEAEDDPDDPDFMARQQYASSRYDDHDQDTDDPHGDEYGSPRGGGEHGEEDDADRMIRQLENKKAKEAKAKDKARRHQTVIAGLDQTQAELGRHPNGGQIHNGGLEGADKEEYRKGYKTGWKQASKGKPKDPQGKSAPYMSGYTAGLETSGHANAVSSSYAEAKKAHAAGDFVGAERHLKDAQDASGPLMTSHHKGWLDNHGGEGGPLDQTISTWAGHPANPGNAERAADKAAAAAAGVALPKTPMKRTGFVAAIARKTRETNAAHAGEHDDDDSDSGGRDHPANFGGQIGQFGANYARRSDLGQSELEGKDTRAGKARGNFAGGYRVGAGGSLVGREDRREADTVKDPDQWELATKLYKEQLGRELYGEEAAGKHDSGEKHHEGLQAFQDTEHESPEHARADAHNTWKNGIIAQIKQHDENNDQRPLFMAHPVIGHPPDGKTFNEKGAPTNHQTMRTNSGGQTTDADHPDLARTEFNPSQYLIDRLNHPNGFHGDKASIDVARKQMGPNYAAHSVAYRDSAGLKKKKNLDPGASTVNTAILQSTNWLHKNIPDANLHHPMWEHHYGVATDNDPGEIAVIPGAMKRKGTPAPRSAEAQARDNAARAAIKGLRKIRGPRQKRAEEVVRHMLSIVESWLTENVTLDESQLTFAVESIYSKFRANYSHLLED